MLNSKCYCVAFVMKYLWTHSKFYDLSSNKIVFILKADDIQGNILSNFARQPFLSNVTCALARREWVKKINLDNLDQSWALSLTWLPVDGNINQSCLATLLKNLPCVSFAYKGKLDQCKMNSGKWLL